MAPNQKAAVKTMIDPLDYANLFCKALPKGILLTTKSGERVNTMVIGWGAIGIDWAKPVLTAYIRTGRFSHDLIEETGQFCVSVPVGEYDKQIIKVAGSKSGRDMDKIAELGLTLIEPEEIDVPAVAEFPLTFECKLLYKQDQIIDRMPSDIVDKFYPRDVSPQHTGANCDTHTAYYAEIVSAYLIEQ